MDELIERMQTHFFSDGFQEELDGWVRDHCLEFANIDPQDASDTRDLSHEHWSRYQEFVALFDGKVDAFLEAEHMDSDEFLKLAQDHDSASMLMNLVLATTSFPAFVVMMQAEGQDERERRDGSSGK